MHLRGDSGFASPDLYRACEDHDCKYAIRLKINKTLIALAEDKVDALRRVIKENMVDYKEGIQDETSNRASCVCDTGRAACSAAGFTEKDMIGIRHLSYLIFHALKGE